MLESRTALVHNSYLFRVTDVSVRNWLALVIIRSACAGRRSSLHLVLIRVCRIGEQCLVQTRRSMLVLALSRIGSVGEPGFLWQCCLAILLFLSSRTLSCGLFVCRRNRAVNLCSLALGDRVDLSFVVLIKVTETDPVD